MKGIFDQTYTNWRIIYVNDFSTDDTDEKFHRLSKEHMSKITYIKTKKNYKQAYCRYIAYNLCEDEEFCVLLDGDDWLDNKFVLEYLNFFIMNNDVDMTYGSYRAWDGKVLSDVYKCNTYSYNAKKNNSYRSKWITSHLRVIKAKYLKNIKYKHLLDNSNNFLDCCTDLNESWACLEQSNGRHKLVKETMMIYNKENSMKYANSYFNSNKKNQHYRKQVIDLLKKRKYDRYKKEDKKIVKVYIDKNEDYQKFLKNPSLFNEPSGIKILCIPSYLEELYDKIEKK